MKLRRIWRRICLLWGGIWFSAGTGSSYVTLWEKVHDDSELIGLEAEGAPIAKLLYAIVAQAKEDEAKAISFSLENDQFRVYFWSECETLEPSGASRETMSGPGNLLRPLICHALWVLNHRAPMYEKVRGASLLYDPDFIPARWRADAPECRCWLRNPHDYTSLVIQLL